MHSESIKKFYDAINGNADYSATVSTNIANLAEMCREANQRIGKLEAQLEQEIDTNKRLINVNKQLIELNKQLTAENAARKANHERHA